MLASEPVRVKLWGGFACYSRPELKVERVSYPVMTPSAARGALEAVLWKPELRWAIDRIEVLRPIVYLAVRRNEVQTRANSRAAELFAREGRDPAAFPVMFAGAGGEVNTQRNTLALRDVAYVVTARMLVREEVAAQGNPPRKYQEMFLRRVARGQCYHTPYFGCREFIASFGPPGDGDRPLPVTADLGLMLYDIAFGTPNVPVFFPARLEAGVLDTTPEHAVPDADLRGRLGLC